MIDSPAYRNLARYEKIDQSKKHEFALRRKLKLLVLPIYFVVPVLVIVAGGIYTSIAGREIVSTLMFPLWFVSFLFLLFWNGITRTKIQYEFDLQKKLHSEMETWVIE